MTYARVRLWLGISGVGLIVIACTLAILFGLPEHFLPTSQQGSVADLGWLAVVFLSIVALMAPLDFFGGYFATTRFNQQPISFSRYLKGWARGVIVQSTLFMASSLTILAIGRFAGLTGATISIVLMSIGYVAIQSRLVLAITARGWKCNDDKVNRSLERTSQWGLRPLSVTVIQNTDPGFTGGIVGLPWSESIILPRDYVDRLTANQLAVVLARRLVAVESGSRTRGIFVALGWILVGFTLAASLPGAGVTSVAELATTCLGFTVWTFLGLLVLPTVSRQSSYAIDREVQRRGAEAKTLSETIRALDVVQDDEPSRPALIEAIFHPVPSVDNRQSRRDAGSPLAWHAARMTLFLSWSCMGLLARAVHCNVGRPELWAMLPTD